MHNHPLECSFAPYVKQLKCKKVAMDACVHVCTSLGKFVYVRASSFSASVIYKVKYNMERRIYRRIYKAHYHKVATL